MATFFNQATLTYKNTSTTSNVVTGEIVQVLAAEKTAISPGYTIGERVTYVISVVNSGTLPFTDLTVTDNLGAYEFGASALVPLTYEEGSVRYYVNGVLQADPTVVGTSPLVVSGIDIPAKSLDEYSERLLVTPKDIDIHISDMGRILGYAVNSALHPEITIEEMDEFLS